MPRRPAGPPTLAALITRLEGLEQRLLQLETGRVGPGDGRAAVARPGRPVRRCPGCGLPLRRRNGRCAACKRPLESI
jgi:hypothetical protein